MKKALVLFLILALCLSFSGCKKGEEKPAEMKKKVEEKEEEDEPEEVEEVEENLPANQNLLTGVADLSEGAIGKRPVAVMVNNIPAAMPQYGVAKADIIFEIPVEGDATRFMALYADYTTIPRVCAVRSCRSYFPALSQGFDAFYVNWGIDDTIGDYLTWLQLDQFDGMYDGNGLFARDQERINAGYSLEHTAYFEGTAFGAVIDSQGYRSELSENMKGTAFSFHKMEEQVKPEGGDCTSVNINFGAQTSQFTYDSERNLYLKQLNGTPQIDGSTQEQLAFTNLFVLETDISVRDEVGHKEVNWAGGSDSTGYYVSNGGVQRIHWSKEAESQRLKFFDENGKELKINRGKSYIAVNYRSQAVFQ